MLSVTLLSEEDVNATAMQVLVWHQQEKELARLWFANVSITLMVQIAKNVLPSSRIDLGGEELPKNLMNVCLVTAMVCRPVVSSTKLSTIRLDMVVIVSTALAIPKDLTAKNAFQDTTNLKEIISV